MAGTTVVSARTLSTLMRCAALAFSSSFSFNALTVTSPQRVVIFINVLGSGTASLIPMRQNRRQVNESVTSAQRVSKPSR